MDISIFSIYYQVGVIYEEMKSRLKWPTEIFQCSRRFCKVLDKDPVRPYVSVHYASPKNNINSTEHKISVIEDRLCKDIYIFSNV